VFRRLPRQLLLIGLLLIGLVTPGAVRTNVQAQQADRPIDLWRLLQHALTSEKGAAYFKQIQGSEIPPERRTFEGRVVSQPSAAELIVNVDNARGDAKLEFDHALKTVRPGTLIYFKGVVHAWVKEPYMLTLNVEDEGVPVWIRSSPQYLRIPPRSSS
jgi:hypothetical protein